MRKRKTTRTACSACWNYFYDRSFHTWEQFRNDRHKRCSQFGGMNVLWLISAKALLKKIQRNECNDPVKPVISYFADIIFSASPVSHTHCQKISFWHNHSFENVVMFYLFGAY